MLIMVVKGMMWYDSLNTLITRFLPTKQQHLPLCFFFIVVHQSETVWCVLCCCGCCTTSLPSLLFCSSPRVAAMQKAEMDCGQILLPGGRRTKVTSSPTIANSCRCMNGSLKALWSFPQHLFSLGLFLLGIVLLCLFFAPCRLPNECITANFSIKNKPDQPFIWCDVFDVCSRTNSTRTSVLFLCALISRQFERFARNL